MVYVGMDVRSKSLVVQAIDECKRVVWRGEVAPTHIYLGDYLLDKLLAPEHPLIQGPPLPSALDSLP